MQKLSDMDASFVYQESPSTPMHITLVVVYDQSRRAGGRLRFKEILEVFRRNLHKSTIFRRKLAGGAMGLDTPYWVEDPHFDLEFHLRHIALPKPGDWRQFCILLARLHSRGLDMRRPLWEAYVIEGLSQVEGLPRDSFAIMLKVHHSAIDGVSGAEILTAIHSLSDELDTSPIIDTWKGERDPAALKVWSRAYLKNIQRPVTLARKLGHLVPAFLQASRQAREAGAPERAPLVHTRFNGPVSATRVTDALRLELADIKRIRKAVPEATVNDVIVAIVGGALRRYLSDKGELPDSSLACGAPISVRAERNSDSHGNQVSQMTISLATDIEDPLERLAEVHRSANRSKAFSDALGTSVLMDMSEVMIPQMMGWGMRTAGMAAGVTDLPMPMHVVVSNVPGPQVPLYLHGARVHLLMGMGPLLHMMGLFHGVVSACGKITINFVSTREMMPDPDFYRECLRESFDELLACVKSGGGS